MGSLHHVQGGLMAVPWPLLLLFAAPVLALLLGFFVMKPAAPRYTHLPILLSCAIIAACAVWALAQVWVFQHELDLMIGNWMVAGDWLIQFGIRVDGLSASVLAMVAIVGGLIHVYASGYMAEDPGFSRFFLAFHLFFLSMIGLLLSNNYVQMYMFWELTGLASYLLIGHWLQKQTARKAAFQAFMVNRIGDFGFMLAIFLLLYLFHNTRFALLFPALSARDPMLIALVGGLLFWAACGKSAQFPLYFWLPDAMEGPTPVSALMHAATMVTAGVFLVARSWPLISSVPGLPAAICGVGAFTAIYAGLLAGTRKDLKRILAYSTVSHLGIMMFGLGLLQPAAAVFHLITHGFFKAVLFLCAGSIAHALHQPTANVDEVGGLRKAMPLTFICFTVAALSLSGIPPFAGFYSKDAILGAAVDAGGWRAFAGLLIGVISGFYIFRMLFLAFFGPNKRQHGPGHFHEPGPVFGVPITFLAIGALSVGWLHHPFSRMMEFGWLGGVLPPVADATWGEIATGSGAALLGAALAWWVTLGMPEFDWTWRANNPGLERWFDADFGYKPAMLMLASGFKGFANGIGRVLDKQLWDGLLEGSADVARGLGTAGSEFATGLVNDYLWWMLMGAAALLYTALRAGAVR